jgi:6-methylsalicylate decarboxylase
MSTCTCIDVHGHIIPPAYKQALIDTGLIERDRFPLPSWDAELNLEHMEKMGISSSILSLSSPDAHLDDDQNTRLLYRAINEVGAEVVRNHPDRFGYFAALPLPDVEGALQEVTYAYEQLKVDGIRLTTNTKGLYLGEAPLEPLFERLNHYKAVVFIHPCKPAAVPAEVLTGYPVPMMEFMFDTARAVSNLVVQGVVVRYPQIRYVIPHAGGVLPIVVSRVHSLVQVTRKPEERADVLGGFRSLYYDTAGPSIQQQLRPLLNITDDSHLLCGTDWPHVPTDECIAQREVITSSDQLTGEQKRRLFRDNALTLFPRFGREEAAASFCIKS